MHHNKGHANGLIEGLKCHVGGNGWACNLPGRELRVAAEIWKPWHGSWRDSIDNYQAATGSIRLASLFLTFPTRALTGHAIIAPVYGTSIDFS